jgi:hypothetical protein
MEPKLTVQYEDEVFVVTPGTPFDIGRDADADLALSENRFLHRRFLRLVHEAGFWWLANIGTNMAATVSDPRTGTQAWLGPGGRLPVTFADLLVVFTAGPCAYEVVIHNSQPVWQEAVLSGLDGETTVSALELTRLQKLVVVALAEPMLRRDGSGVIVLPSNAEAAQRLAWNLKRFNRKLDNVCDKLDRLGVDGLRGGVKTHASNRRARLIEWAVATGLVAPADLALLDEASDDEEDGEP